MLIYGVFSGPYFPAFRLNTEIYGENLRIQSQYRTIGNRKSSVFGYSHAMKETKTVKDRILRDIKNLFRYEEEKYYITVRINIFRSNSNIEYARK